MTMESLHLDGDDHGDHGDGDEESVAVSSNYPQSWSSGSFASTTFSHMLPPGDQAQQLEQIYLSTKTDMLEIIEEGLQLKLEIQGIKDQFLHLVHDIDDFDQQEVTSGDMSHIMDIPPRPGTKPSAARSRVRALYEARKARIRARRSAGSMESSIEPPPKLRKVEDEEDKENVFRRPVVIPRHSKRSVASLPDATSTPMANSSQVPMRAMTWSIRKFLTPVKEELQDQSVNVNNCLPRLTPKHNSVSRRSSSKSRDRSSKLSNLDSMMLSSSKSSTGSSSRVQDVFRQTVKSSRLSEGRLQPDGDMAPPKPKKKKVPTATLR